jgi:uncharacterized protein YaiL (DUF2058 family)
MSDSLRDQLLKAGFIQKPSNESRQGGKPRPQGGNPRPSGGKPRPQDGRPRPQGRPHPQGGKPHARPEPSGGAGQQDINLARAYALRERTEREKREREQREAEQRAKVKKERRQKLGALLDGKALNEKEAEIPRHFPHANKIRRIYVTAEQLPRLNGGELAVVQLAGRYLLVARDDGLAAKAIDPDALVLLCDAHASDEDDVPADLVW